MNTGEIKEFESGDLVFHYKYGWGEVVSVFPDHCCVDFGEDVNPLCEKALLSYSKYELSEIVNREYKFVP